MQKNQQKLAFGKIFFISSATLCATLFIFFSGRVSVLHSSDLFDWETFIPKLGRIEPLNYFINILWAFFGVGLFSLACVSLGAVFISLLWDKKNSNLSVKPARPILIGSAFLVGSGLFSIIFLTLGGLYNLTAAYVIALLFGGLILGFRSFIKFFKNHSEDDSLNLFVRTKNK